MNESLYELSNEYIAAIKELEDLEIDEKSRADTLESIVGPVEDKCVAVVSYARNLEVMANAIKIQAAVMTERRLVLERRVDHLMQYAQQHMIRCNLKKILNPIFDLSIVKTPDRVVIDDEGLFPLEYLRIIPEHSEPDKMLLKMALKDGAVDGCHLESGTRLAVK